ncbi:MAG: SDR family oxidoreductase [Rhizobiaceae bacterium]
MGQPLPHALVTGGGTGIGLAVARRLASTHRVTIVGRRADVLREAAAAIGGDVQAVAADVTEGSAVDAAFAQARRRFGPVSVLVNNAGAAWSGAILDQDEEALLKVLQLNVVQVHRCIRAALPDMLEARTGRIVNVASTAGLVGYSFVSAYCAAKHAVIGLTRALALELVRKGVTVNAVCPGYTDTDLVSTQVETLSRRSGGDEASIRQKLTQTIPLGRLIRPDEVAAAVDYLCRPEAGAVTGQALVVAGGEYMAG